jgi:hypothetical protein
MKKEIQDDFKNTTPIFYVENYFGLSEDDIRTKFRRSGSIIIVYDGRNYKLQASNSMEIVFRISFFVVEQTIGVKEKSNFLIDTFLDYITFHNFDLVQTEYPTSDIEPFFPESDVLWAEVGSGISVFRISGYMRMVKNNIQQ